MVRMGLLLNGFLNVIFVCHTMEEFTGKVIEIKDYPSSDPIKARTIKIRVPDTVSFTPGQFVMVANNAVKNKLFPDKLKWASMSVANAPSEKGIIELGMDVGDEGGIRHFVCTQLKVGAEMIVKGPMGTFVFKEEEHEPVLIALGTGITPIMSMVRHALEKWPGGKVDLFYSLKTSEIYLFKDSLEKLAAKHPSFTMNVTVTREDDSWTGLRGRIQQLIKSYDFGDKSKRIFYLCGSPKGVVEIISVIKELGFSDDQIRKEQW
jgi:Na+-transporting NADH:ubiquinone oxidoreductase subunit F